MSAEMVAALLTDICPDCGRTKSQAERAYPVGWAPDVDSVREGIGWAPLQVLDLNP